VGRELVWNILSLNEYEAQRPIIPFVGNKERILAVSIMPLLVGVLQLRKKTNFS
jgi:hypothetical protein